MNIVLFGAPGSGKGTQSEHIKKNYGLHHISTGQVLRDHIERGTELGKIADSFISKGQLIPDDLVLRVVSDILDNDPRAAKGVVFDGFPRSVAQAEALEKLLAERGQAIDAVVGLEVPQEDLIERMLERGRQTGRADDNLDTIKKRMKVYDDTTSPLIDYYTNKGNYHPVDGSGDIASIASNISRTLDPFAKK